MKHQAYLLHHCELLDAVVVPVCDVDVTRPIYGNAVKPFELPVTGALGTPLGQEFPC